MKQIVPIEGMTDAVLLDTYKKGTKWLSDHMQVTGTNKNELGEEITPKMRKQWDAGLKRIEQVEDEMQKRGLAY